MQHIVYKLITNDKEVEVNIPTCTIRTKIMNLRKK
jgi:hypothetical protein